MEVLGECPGRCVSNVHRMSSAQQLLCALPSRHRNHDACLCRGGILYQYCNIPLQFVATQAHASSRVKALQELSPVAAGRNADLFLR